MIIINKLDKINNSPDILSNNDISKYLPFKLKFFLIRTKDNITKSKTNFNEKIKKKNKFEQFNDFIKREEKFLRNKKEKQIKEYTNINKNNNKKIPLSVVLSHYYNNIKKANLNKKLLFEKYNKTFRNNIQKPIYKSLSSNNFSNSTRKNKKNRNINSFDITNKLVNDNYNKIANKIFNLLDKDQDDYLTPITLINSLNKLPNKIYKILFPIIDEIISYQIIYSRKKFLIEMKKLYKKLNYNQKLILRKEYNSNKKQEISNYKTNYKPKINLKSISLAEKYEFRTIRELSKIKGLTDDKNNCFKNLNKSYSIRKSNKSKVSFTLGENIYDN